MLISAVQQSDSVIYIYTHTFSFIVFSLMVCHRIFSIVPCAISKTFIHSVYNSLHLLIPNSHSVPPPSPIPLGNHRSVFYVYDSISVSQTGSFVPYFRLHTYVVSYTIYFSLGRCLFILLENLQPLLLFTVNMLSEIPWNVINTYLQHFIPSTVRRHQWG